MHRLADPWRDQPIGLTFAGSDGAFKRLIPRMARQGKTAGVPTQQRARVEQLAGTRGFLRRHVNIRPLGVVLPSIERHKIEGIESFVDVGEVWTETSSTEILRIELVGTPLFHRCR